MQILYSYISKENHDYLVKELVTDFSTDFQNRLLKFRRWQDAQLSLLGRTLLVKGLENLNLPFSEYSIIYTNYNKPYLEGSKVAFNISHSENIVVCVISENHELGVDIEMIKDIDIEDFKPQTTNLEWQRIIYSVNPINAFFTYWTQKEAVLKAHGMGLSIPLKSFEILDYQTEINGDVFLLKQIRLDKSYICHLAFKNENSPVIYAPQLVDFSTKDK